MSTDVNIMEHEVRMSMIHTSIVSAGGYEIKSGPVAKKSKKLVNYKKELGMEVSSNKP